MKSVKTTSKELQHSELFLDSIVENIPNMIFVKEAKELRFVRFNKAGEKLIGISSKDLIGKNDYDLFPREQAEFFVKKDREVLANRSLVIIPEEPIDTREHGRRWLLTKKIPLLNAAGEPEYLLGISEDITERKKTEEEQRLAREAAEDANRIKSEFLAKVSHEVRTPMNGILGMTDLLLDSQLSVEQREYVDIINSSAKSLLAVINDILDFSKVEAKKLQLSPVSFSLHKILKRVETLFLPIMHERELHFSSTIANDTPDLLFGDPDRLSQILFNLIGNAIKFTPAGGRISLSVAIEQVSLENITLKFCVTDNGIGIAPEKQKIVFDAFIQADSSTTRQFGGTGLGLTISNQLVKLMGGELFLQSTLGEGSSFTFTAVFNHQQANSVLPKIDPVVSKENYHCKPLHILLVEDNKVNQTLILKLLKNEGHTIALAENGMVALNLIADGHFDLVLMDIEMPVMDGIQATKILRETEKISKNHLIVVALTAHAMAGDREKYIALGMDDYLPKPINKNELHETIKRWHNAKTLKK